MLPHQEIPGVINTADMFTRLLYSVIVTGLAPKSFHHLAADGSRMPVHYDGLPVDVVAASVIAPSASSAPPVILTSPTWRYSRVHSGKPSTSLLGLQSKGSIKFTSTT